MTTMPTREEIEQARASFQRRIVGWGLPDDTFCRCGVRATVIVVDHRGNASEECGMCSNDARDDVLDVLVRALAPQSTA